MAADLVIRAVVDASALLSYARGHVHVGELIWQVDEDGAVVGVPALALLDVHGRLLDDPLGRSRLAVLCVSPMTQVLALGAVECAEVANLLPLTGSDTARAHAVWAARMHGAYLATCDPDTVSGLIEDDLVLPVPEDDT